jgi:predicted helicase
MPQHPQAALFAKKGLFKGLNSFQELEGRISQIEEDKAKGDAFEVFVEAYLATQRKHEAQTIWPNQAAPLDLLERLGLTSSDYGVDGLYLTPVGQYNAYQAKFRTGRPGLTWRELSTFMGLADSRNLHNRVLITNCEELPDLLNQRNNFFCIRGTDLDRLDKEALQEISNWLECSVFEKPKKSPRPHQQEAIVKILEEFSKADRATAVMACGTGKTLVGLWVMEALQPKKALILMPSLALIRQTLHEWLQETKTKNFSFLCVCSDQSVSEGTDSLVINQSDLDFEVTTDAKRVREYLGVPFDGTKVVFTTYHSAPVVGDAAGQEELFDYAVFDEAHKTTGKKDRRTGHALSDDKIRIRKRLFLTATPRRFNILKRDAEGEPEEIFSMDDRTIYGNTCFSLSFGKAVDQKIICPYEVLISVITSEMVTNALLKHGEVIVGSESVTALQVAHQIAVRDAVERYGVKKVFTFHSTVKAAAVFTGEGAEGIRTHLPGCQTYHVNGSMPSNHREKVMKAFCKSGLALMSNARCLTEGVDVPAVDMVAFLSPRKSQIDIIQAAGRAMRNAEGKEKGYILVPLLVEQQRGESIDSAVLRADYVEVWNVLQCLQEQDDVLADIVNTYGRIGDKPNRGLRDAKTERRIQILAPKIALKRIEEAIIANSLDRLTSAWEAMYAEFQFYYAENLHCNAEVFLGRTEEDKKALRWISEQRNFYKKGKLSENRIRRLEQIGIIWEFKAETPDSDWEEWEQYFYRLIQHKKKKGNFISTNNSDRKWLFEMIAKMIDGSLSPYKAKLLRCIGVGEGLLFELGVAKTGSTNSYDRARKAKNTEAHTETGPTRMGAKKQDELKDGTGSWQENYEKLHEWWDKRRNYFFSHMKNNLREWAKEQCVKKKAGELPKDKIALLDQIEFPWNRF